MIEIWSYRQKNGPEILLNSRYAETEEAVRSLCKYELGYGGTITGVTDDRLEVVTQILHNKDRTVYTGTKEAMKDLLVAAHLWMKAEKEVSFDDWWNRVSDMTHGVPLLVAVSAGIIRGDLVMEKLSDQLTGMA